MDDNEFYEERLLKNENLKVFIPDTPHIIRGSISGEGFNNDNLLELLENDYPEIHQSILDEDYFISADEKFFYFYEICDEDKIVGFASFTIYGEKSISLNQIYVMSEYRGQKHFVKTYNYFSTLLPECEILVHNPNHHIVSNILNLDYCRVIDERFLISNIVFITDQVSLEDSLKYTNKTFYESGNTIKYQTESNLYDLKLDAVIKLSHNNKEFTGKEDLLLVERSNISLVRDEDEKLFNVLDKRSLDSWIDNGNYFKKINKLLRKKKIKVNR